MKTAQHFVKSSRTGIIASALATSAPPILAKTATFGHDAALLGRHTQPIRSSARASLHRSLERLPYGLERPV